MSHNPYPPTVYKWATDLSGRTKAKSFLKEIKIPGLGKIEWNTKSTNCKAKGITSFTSAKLTCFSIDAVKKGRLQTGGEHILATRYT